MLPLITVCLGVMILCYLVFMRFKRIKDTPVWFVILLKCGATAAAAFIALQAAFLKGSVPVWLIFAGLAVCTAADGVLHVRFIPGGILFGIGHLVYITAFCLMQPNLTVSAVVFPVLAAGGACFLLGPKKRCTERYTLIYAAVLFSMVALAAGCGLVYGIGAVLFAVSDGLLLVRRDSRHPVLTDYMSLGLYYAGQFLLALAAII